MEQSSKWFKNNPNDKIWWLDDPGRKGEWRFLSIRKQNLICSAIIHMH